MGNKYYLDESGNTGDLISKKFDLNFANQPIFTLTCVKVNNTDKIKSLVNQLKKKYKIQGNELKSTSIYKKPKFLLEVCKFIQEENIPFFIEVVDKKYHICSTIVNHYVLPPYFQGDESNGQTQEGRNVIADYLSLNLPNSYYKSFFNACLIQSEESLLAIMNLLKDYFKNLNDDYQVFYKLVEESIDDYKTMKELHGQEEALMRFFPLSDKNKRNAEVILLSHVSSMANILARVNLENRENNEEVTFIHDNQDHFDEILQSIKTQTTELDISENLPKIITADFNLPKNSKLLFEDSKDYIGIQIADILGGFMARYFKDILYDKKNIDDIYHEIFHILINLSNPNKGIGTNMVLPTSLIEKMNINFQRNF